jgi:hypothetical protein
MLVFMYSTFFNAADIFTALLLPLGFMGRGDGVNLACVPSSNLRGCECVVRSMLQVVFLRRPPSPPSPEAGEGVGLGQFSPLVFIVKSARRSHQYAIAF